MRKMKRLTWDETKITAFQEALVSWYEANKRILPWRENTEPYRIWVSEIMLQQTKVDTVIPYFNRFMTQFPTMESFVNADEADILKAWEGLGYYSRVRNLQTAMKQVMTDFSGEVPSDLTTILSLKGVGPYTAGAILSIAYNQAEPAVDGNVMRVIARVLEISEDITKASTRKIFEEVLYQLIDQENPAAFNQGLMEIGALVCTPTKPMCLL
ncbi:A/G-specific adenine glycosylase, partial [Listeria innocua]|nr:A/G-specific adenine glycosylase [Listeria innocua]